MSKQTFYFEEIFPEYADFKAVTDLLNLYVDDASELVNQKLYDLLMRRFCKDSIAYDTPEAFIVEFSLAYEENFKQYIAKNKLVDAINELTVEDFKVLTESLSNSALNPNNAPEDPKQPLPYVSSQLYNLNKSGPLGAFLGALDNVPTARNYEFLNKFEYLFLQILVRKTALYD